MVQSTEGRSGWQRGYGRSLHDPLVLTPQPEGGYTVTSPVLPELVTEGGTPDEAIANVPDALKAVIETYEDLGRPLPANLRQNARR
ncbi:MAG TPA: type II toxin-antitoxin system HicB family antitoxin [Chloroflexota bacterium]|nr:type II toxin-antitoxin system HicB family antitoxin [Chloroflexota bacterium]